MAKKIVRTAGATLAAGAILLGSTVPANAFAQIPAAADLSYDYTNYEFDYTSYNPRNHLRCVSGSRATDLRCSRSSSGTQQTWDFPTWHPQAETQQAYVLPRAGSSSMLLPTSFPPVTHPATQSLPPQ